MAKRRKKDPSPKRPVGRPRSVMTPEIEDAILRTVRLGLHADRAAQAHGVSASTMRSHKKEHPEFRTRLKEAEASAEHGFLARIVRHTETQWTAAAWVLERRFGWVRHEKVAVDSKAQIAHSGSIETGPPVPPSKDLAVDIDKLKALRDELLGDGE